MKFSAFMDSLKGLFGFRKNDQYRLLVNMLLGDRASAERLIKMEQRTKGLNRSEAIRHAVMRLERDRR